MTDPTLTPPPDDTGEELAVDVRAFLPDGVSLEGDEPADAGTAPSERDDRPEPEIPAWALDDPDPNAPGAVVAEVDGDIDDRVGDVGDDDLEAIAVDEVPAIDLELVEVEGLVVVDTVPEPAEPESAIDEAPGSEPESAQAEPEAVVDQDDEAEQGDEAETVADQADQADQDDEVDEVDEVDDGPALPAWALPDPIVDHDVDGADRAADPQDAVAAGGAAVDGDAGATADGEAEPPEPEKVDTSVLEEIEGELAEVEAALAAIDAGDLDRSPLLVRLLADRG